jgi:hypothetical protein
VDREVTGLCGACVYARCVTSARGSVFWLCARSATDPRFAKYPALPMRACAGYETMERPEGEGGGLRRS